MLTRDLNRIANTTLNEIKPEVLLPTAEPFRSFFQQKYILFGNTFFGNRVHLFE